MKKLFSSALLLSVLFSFASSAEALTFESSQEDQFSISVPVRDDLYAVGGAIRVEERVVGDLVIAGGDITVVGDVAEDLIVGGGRIAIEGGVGDDARIAGGEIVVMGDVADDLIIVGGNIRVASDATIGGDLVMMGGTLVMDGTVAGALQVKGGDISLNGSVKGDMSIQNGKMVQSGTVGGNARIVARKAFFDEGASIGGDLEYWVKGGERDFGDVVKGTTTFNQELKMYDDRKDKEFLAGGLTVAFLMMMCFSILFAALIILLLTLLNKSFMTNAAKNSLKKPWKAVWHGFLFFVLTPIGAVVLMMTIIGIPIGIFMFAMYGFMLLLAKPFTAFVLTHVVDVKYKKKWSKTMIFFMSVLFFILLKIACLIPILGWLLVAAAVFFAFGMLLEAKWAIWQKHR